MTALARNIGRIVVIADDLSGAAELAGAAHQRGLNAMVLTTFATDDTLPDADVIAIDADTRSMSAADAAARVAAIAGAIATTAAGTPSAIRWIYKKCDSVLRGRVLPEVQSLLSAAGKRRAILVPANPGRGRVIVNGRYFINGVPLNQTGFADDPEYPRRSADVNELLTADGDSLADDRVVVPDAASAADLARWASHVEGETLPAGAVEFFEALLDRDGHPLPSTPSDDPPAADGSTLLVCGSAAGWRSGRSQQCDAAGVPVHVMPRDEDRWTSDAQSLIAAWAGDTRRSLRMHGVAMTAIGAAEPVAGVSAIQLAERLAAVVAIVVAHEPPRRLLIEGGGTAAIVLAALGWRRLNVAHTWATGVVELTPAEGPGLSVVVKVGSYAWPASVWRFAKGSEHQKSNRS